MTGARLRIARPGWNDHGKRPRDEQLVLTLWKTSRGPDLETALGTLGNPENMVSVCFGVVPDRESGVLHNHLKKGSFA